MCPGWAHGVGVGGKVAVGFGVEKGVSVGVAGATAVLVAGGGDVKATGGTAVGGSSAEAQPKALAKNKVNPTASASRQQTMRVYQGYWRGGSDNSFLRAPCHSDALRVIVLI